MSFWKYGTYRSGKDSFTYTGLFFIHLKTEVFHYIGLKSIEAYVKVSIENVFTKLQ